MEPVTFISSTGQQMVIYFFNGSPLSSIPDGWGPVSEENKELYSAALSALGTSEGDEFELNNSLSTANHLFFDTTVKGSLSSVNDVDAFWFNVSIPQQITVNFAVEPSSDLGTSSRDYFNIAMTHDADGNGFIEYSEETYINLNIGIAAQPSISLGNTGVYHLEIANRNTFFTDEHYRLNITSSNSTNPQIDVEGDYEVITGVEAYPVSYLIDNLNYADPDGYDIQGLALWFDENKESEHAPVIKLDNKILELASETSYYVYRDGNDWNFGSDLEIISSEEFSIIEVFVAAFDGTKWSDWDSFELVSQ